MSSLGEIWPIIKAALDDGISLIPVYDKNVTIGSRTHVVKSPCLGKWKDYQKFRMSEDELFHHMEHYDTCAVGQICGKISGNIEVIDVDVKYNEGFGSILFKDIQEILPDLWPILKINKTPSGGYHIIYRVSDHDVPGSEKLAGRDATPEELEKSPKNKVKNFLETKAEGGYVLLPPSGGYSSYKNDKIPVINWEQRCSLISLCKGYDQVKKIVKSETVSRSVQDYFDEDPFTHFNNSVEAERVLLNNDWKEAGRSNKFVWYTRPGKTSGVSASFNKETRCYYIFTSNSDFDSEKGYKPSTALCILEHNGDRKKTYQYLIKSGYGKINPKKEKDRAERLAKAKKPLPNNFSEEAKKTYDATIAKMEELHPFGTFWKFDFDIGKLTISREALLVIAQEIGFRLYRGELILIKGQFLYDSNEREFQDAMKEYIKEEDADENEKIKNLYESFMQKSGKYTISRIQILDDSNILRDTRDVCFKFYKNCYVEIKADGYETRDYEDLNQFVFYKKINNRDFVAGSGGKYIEYLTLATNFEYQKDHIMKCIGFLAHEFKDETCGYIIVLTEQCADPKDGGGSGKNVFCNLLSNVTSYHSKNGSQVSFDEKFFQSWNGQRIMGISDVPKNFNFAFLKEPSTGTFILKKLFKDEVEIPVEDGPKFVIQTNYSYEITDGGLNRRIIHIEFTNFFTSVGGIDTYFGCHFPKGWSAGDWAGFDTFVIESIQLWLASGLKLKRLEMTESGWNKQFEQSFGAVACSIVTENIDEWIIATEVENETIQNCINKYFVDNNISTIYRPSRQKINSALEFYCHKNGIEFVKSHVMYNSITGKSVRGYKFLKANNTENNNNVDNNTDEDWPF